MFKKAISVLLICLTLFTTVSYAAVNSNPFNDTDKHWAKELLIKKYKQGLVEGYPNGSFKPDGSLSKGELVTVVNRSFGLSKKEDNDYKDMTGKEWYSNEADKAYYYEYVRDNKLNGDIPATRMDAVKMISYLLDLEVDTEGGSFTDTSSLNPEEKLMLDMFAEMGYMQGNGDGTAQHERNLTRAEMLKLTDNVLGYIVVNQEDVANIPEKGRVTIIGQNIIIEGKQIENLYISAGVYTNTVIKNCKIKETLEVANEGTDGELVIDNTEVKNMEVRPKAKELIIKIIGKSEIKTIKIENQGTIKGESTVKIDSIVIEESSPTLENIKVENDLVIKGGEVDLKNANLNSVIVKGKCKINTDEKTEIDNLEVKAGTKITGKGSIKDANIKVPDVTIETTPKHYKVSSGVVVNVGGKEATSKNDKPKPSRSSGKNNSSTGESTTYIVTFNDEGRTTPAAITVIANKKIFKPTNLTREGNTFEGWYKESNLINKWDFDRDIVTSNITLYAKWKEIEISTTYKVILEGNGKTSPVVIAVTKNGNMVKPTTPTKEGYTFEGWYKESNLINKWDFDRDIVTSNITLYAKWKEIEIITRYKVIFNDKGRTTPAAITVITNNKILKPTELIREGYTFEGWYKESNLINKWDFDRDIVTSNITLYAKWKETEIITRYKVIFNDEGRTTPAAITVIANNKILKPTNPTREGYIFEGWYKENSLTNKWDFDRDTVTSNITLYAKWKSTGTGTSTMLGAGTKENPYQIQKIEDLVAIGLNDKDRLLLKYDKEYKLTDSFILMRDLDFQIDSDYRDPNFKFDADANGTILAIKTELIPDNTDITLATNKGFKPILKLSSIEGAWPEEFEGSFYGNNKTISNLYINRKNEECVGLFASIYIKENTINNLTLANANVTGLSRVGALAGAAYGDSGIIENVFIQGNVTAKETVGGLVGWCEPKITNCSMEGVIAASERCVGGLVGESHGNIADSHSKASVTVTNVTITNVINEIDCIGGLVGTKYTYAEEEKSSIINSYATGKVTASDDSNYVGGLVGNVGNVIITDSYATGDVSGKEFVGGLVGGNDASIIDTSYAIGNVSGKHKVGGLVGRNTQNSKITNSYAIGQVLGFVNIGGLAGSNENSVITTSYAKGAVTGNGIEEYGNVGGLVGYNFDQSTITTSYASGNVSGKYTVGGLVGANIRSNIYNSYSISSVTGTISNTGGLVGFNQNYMNNYGAQLINTKIQNCYAAGVVNGGNTGTRQIVSAIDQDGNAIGYSTEDTGVNVGGLIGYNYIGDDVSTMEISNCVSFNPSVTGSYNVGRVYGYEEFYGDKSLGERLILSNNYAFRDMEVIGDTIGDLRKDMRAGWNMWAYAFINPESYIEGSGSLDLSDWLINDETGAIWQVNVDNVNHEFRYRPVLKNVGNDDGVTTLRDEIRN